jgi:hypothetical protein
MSEVGMQPALVGFALAVLVGVIVERIGWSIERLIKG